MENTNTKTEKAQGANTVPEKEERNPSSTYTIKSLAGNIKKLEKLKMCTPEEIKELKRMHKGIMERWIGGNLGL